MMLYPFLAVLIFSATYFMGMVPLSFDAFIQPYTGKFALPCIVLTILAVVELPVYYFLIYSRYKKDLAYRASPGAETVVLYFPTVIGAFGFVIGFLNRDPWIALPFISLGFAVSACAFFTTRGIEPE
ncbi:MAG: hypothetical protein PHF60_00640 [Candidatus ainarchaeum sp.]|nr:hypothetical protein [Candidatus ainarchaeum sp.]